MKLYTKTITFSEQELRQVMTEINQRMDALQLFEDERTVAIPIIFLPARAEFRDRARGLDIGGVDYVTKPFNPLELAPLVQKLLDRLDRGERDELRAEKLSELRTLMESE